MKELITTQLIEEYQKRLALLNNLIDDSLTASFDRVIFTAQRNELQSIIRSLQSKQSEERQNIANGFEDGREDCGEFGNCVYKSGEDYFNQTFKQEQK